MVDMADSDDLMGSEESMVEGYGRCWDKLMRRRRMKRSVRRCREMGDFEKHSEIGDGVLGSAMQFERKDHPPRAHKGSISMNQLQQG